MKIIVSGAVHIDVEWNHGAVLRSFDGYGEFNILPSEGITSIRLVNNTAAPVTASINDERFLSDTGRDYSIVVPVVHQLIGENVSIIYQGALDADDAQADPG